MDFMFKVTGEETNLILQSLGEMPAKMSMGLIGKLQEQANSQIQASQQVIAEPVATE